MTAGEFMVALSRDQMVHQRFTTECQRSHRFIQDTQACRGALVLSQILKPGLDEEGFHEPLILRDILKDAPRVGAIASALFTEFPDRCEESSAVRRRDAVLNRDQNPAMALKQGAFENRGRPVHGWCKIECAAGVQFPTGG